MRRRTPATPCAQMHQLALDHVWVGRYGTSPHPCPAARCQRSMPMRALYVKFQVLDEGGPRAPAKVCDNQPGSFVGQ